MQFNKSIAMEQENNQNFNTMQAPLEKKNNKKPPVDLRYLS